MINELAQKIHQNAKEKGFHDGEENIPKMLCLIHSEVSEALEADRTGNYYKGDIQILNGEQPRVERSDEYFKHLFETCGVKSSFQDELADIVIRVLDLAALKGINLESHIKAKMRYNSLRKYKHGNKY